MAVDLDSLGTVTRLADAGATAASASLSALTGIETEVDVTRVRVSTAEDVRRTLAEPFVGVRIGFDGGLAGETLLWFDPACADRVVESLLPDADEADSRAGLQEVGNITISGFIDGWADYLGETIDITPPEFVEREGADAGVAGPLGGLLDDTAADTFVFESELRGVGEDLSFRIFMFPTPESVAGSPFAGVPVDRLGQFNALVEDGARQATANMSAMTGIDAEVAVSTLTFVPIESIPGHLDGDVRVGTVLEFGGPPEGYIAILFDEPSAEGVVEALMPGAEGEGFEGMRQSAIQEIGNVLTSGFVDGWANALETTIDISPPQFVHDMGPAILDPLAATLAATQDHAFLVESEIRTPERAFGCEVYALPKERDLERALETLPTAAD
jgi:chemotaxis protein CheC